MCLPVSVEHPTEVLASQDQISQGSSSLGEVNLCLDADLVEHVPS